MLQFVDIQTEKPYQDRSGISAIGFGLQYSRTNYPLDFQYSSDETAITTFVAIRVNNSGQDMDASTLSISLINADGSYHVCDGQTEFATRLSCGKYYFLVNGRYKSDLFQVVELENLRGVGYDIIGSTLVVY